METRMNENTEKILATLARKQNPARDGVRIVSGVVVSNENRLSLATCQQLP